MKSDFDELGVVGLVNISRSNELRTWLQNNHIDSFWLYGSKVVDGLSFFAQAAVDIPQPEEMPARSWNGFLDNLRSVLYETHSKRVVFVWLDVDKMLDHGLNDLIIATDILTSVAREIGSNDASYKHIEAFWTVLLGSGANFR